jgi:hypothetical protein
MAILEGPGIQSLKDAWWAVVADCLVEFHGYSRSYADAAAAKLRARIESPPPGLESDILYHDEPFDVASRLAGASLEMPPPRDRYHAIRDRRFGGAERYLVANAAPTERQRRVG